MPKVIINEYDNTSAGYTEETNFTVVVPGPVAESYKEALFDENGVYRCTDANEFVKVVGIVPTANVSTTGKCAEIDVDLNENNIDSGYVTDDFTEADFWTLRNNGKRIYYFESTDEEDGEYIGYIPVDGQITTESEKVKFYPVNTFAEMNIGDTDYVVLSTIGANASDTLVQGNQMAFELLRLGYTVLYKKFNGASVEEYTTEIEDPEFFEALKDRSAYNFRYITTGGITSYKAYLNIVDVANYISDSQKVDDIPEKLSGRGDCIALLDINESDLKNALANITAKTQSAVVRAIRDQVNAQFDAILRPDDQGKYAAIFYPRVSYERVERETDTIKKYKYINGSEVRSSYNNFPASFHYLLCAANYFKTHNEWFAVAGEDGGKSPWKVTGTSFKLGEIAYNALCPRVYKEVAEELLDDTLAGIKYPVNIVAHQKGDYYIWGNRTGFRLDEEGIIASSFLNIRQLCCTFKKFLFDLCKKLSFRPNSDSLWAAFEIAVAEKAEAMKNNEGIDDYRIIRVANNKKALMTARIQIVPIEAVEDFEIGLSLEDNISNISIAIEE